MIVQTKGIGGVGVDAFINIRTGSGQTTCLMMNLKSSQLSLVLLQKQPAHIK